MNRLVFRYYRDLYYDVPILGTIVGKSGKMQIINELRKVFYSCFFRKSIVLWKTVKRLTKTDQRG